MKKKIFLAFVVIVLGAIRASAAIDIGTFNTLLASFKAERYCDESKYINNEAYGGIECFGFANELAVYIFGSYPTNSMSARTVNSGWTRIYGDAGVDNLAIGDIVRYECHSIFITGIDGDTIMYCQANIPYKTNKVTYENFISRSTLKEKVKKYLTHEGATTIGWVAHYNDGVSQRAPIITEITASAKYALVGDSVTFNFPATYASKYELAIENITTGKRIQYTMLDCSTFTQKFSSEGLHKISVNAYGTEIAKFTPLYFEVHSGERPNMYVGGRNDNLYFTPQELSILHNAPMQGQLKQGILTIYKDGHIYCQGNIMDTGTGIYTQYYEPGVYEGNILLTYESGYGVYTKTLQWQIGEPPSSAVITASSDKIKIGETVTFTNPSIGGSEYWIAIGDGNAEIYNFSSSSCSYQFTRTGTYYIYGWSRNVYGTTYPEALTITVGDVPYVSSITYMPQTIKTGDYVTFALNAENANEYSFCIGDGTNVLVDTESVSGRFSANKFTYQFTLPGTYYVWGTAYNDYGKTSINGIQVVVNEVLPQISAFDYRVIDSHIFVELSVSDIADTDKLFFASYDSGGRLIESKIPTLINGKTEMILSLSNVYKIKVFIWDSDFCPIVPSEERLITENPI